MMKTVFFVGAGAVENAWNPVFRALRATWAPGQPDDTEIANINMARLVNHLRQGYQGYDPKNEELRQLKSALVSLRERIATELGTAEQSGELRIRPEFLPVLRTFDGNGGIVVVTTNWDLVVDRAVREFNPQLQVKHVHGSREKPNLLCLPSEVAYERYRNKCEQKHLHDAYGYTVNSCDAADRIVVYGLALSILDAELGQLISTGRHQRPRLTDAYVIDPDPRPVAKRLGVYLEDCWPRSNRIECYHPGYLSKPTVEVRREDVSTRPL